MRKLRLTTFGGLSLQDGSGSVYRRASKRNFDPSPSANDLTSDVVCYAPIPAAQALLVASR
jgi:hypothetical protein